MTPGLRARARRLVAERTDSGSIQLLRYGVVGGAAFLLDFGALWALTELAGLHYLVSAALGFAVGLTVNYCLSVTWVFARRRLASRAGELAAFAAIGVAGVGINELVMWLGTGVLGAHYLASKIAATAIVFLWNFFARKRLLF
jgi:putative flippase GtrA